MTKGIALTQRHRSLLRNSIYRFSENKFFNSPCYKSDLLYFG